MISIGIVLLFGGYSLGSWGYCLTKGWDITLGQWMNPVHPWTWPAGDVPLVPPGQIMPGKTSGSASSPQAPGGPPPPASSPPGTPGSTVPLGAPPGAPYSFH